jgi:hypothetical protein
LTYAQDKLVALGGIVQQLSEALQDKLVAGLWRSRFIQQLCWYTSEFSDSGHSRAESKPWIAPSWSWASCDYATHRGGTRDLGQHRELVKLVELDVPTKPSGALISGYIKLRCRLVPALLRFEQCNGWRNNWMVFSDRDTTFNSKLQLWLDGPCFVDGTDNLNQIHLLMIQEGIDPIFTNDNKVVGIAVIPSIDQENTFVRIGCFFGKSTYNKSTTTQADKLQKKFRQKELDFYSELVERHKRSVDQIIKII